MYLFMTETGIFVHDGEDWLLCSWRGRLASLFVKGKTGFFVREGEDWFICS